MEGSFPRECRCQTVQLTLKNEDNFESSETAHPTTQSHISEDQKPQQHLQTIKWDTTQGQNLPIHMAYHSRILKYSLIAK
jgi:hypothetical protein